MYILYVLPTCPYCMKVISWAEENEVSLELKSILEKENESWLEEKTGKRQVPYLLDTKEKVEMHESDDIIEYLKSKLN